MGSGYVIEGGGRGLGVNGLLGIYSHGFNFRKRPLTSNSRAYLVD